MIATPLDDGLRDGDDVAEDAPVADPAHAWATHAPALAAWTDKHLVNRRDAFGHYIAVERPHGPRRHRLHRQVGPDARGPPAPLRGAGARAT